MNKLIVVLVVVTAMMMSFSAKVFAEDFSDTLNEVQPSSKAGGIYLLTGGMCFGYGMRVTPEADKDKTTYVLGGVGGIALGADDSGIPLGGRIGLAGAGIVIGGILANSRNDEYQKAKEAEEIGNPSGPSPDPTSGMVLGVRMNSKVVVGVSFTAVMLRASLRF